MKRKIILGLLILTIVFTMAASPLTVQAGSNWWDKFGVPQYGGTLTVRTTSLKANFDPYNWLQFSTYHNDQLFHHNWTIDRSEWDFQSLWIPEMYRAPAVAESWEWKDPRTAVVHINKGIKWHNKPPANGREFTAYDVQFHYDRALGTGSGFNKPNKMLLGFTSSFQQVTAQDKYTVVFKFKSPAAFMNSEILVDEITQMFELPEAVKSGEISDWKKACGIGAFMVADYVAGTSQVLTKNPDYYGYDARHPENRLPYIDTIKIVHIKDDATAIAALRTGKIDYLDNLRWQQAENLAKTNPELEQKSIYCVGQAFSVRCDLKPFSDIKVRQALQMALDLKTIAKTHYGGSVDGIPHGIMSSTYKGWHFPYDEWPKELKDVYSYNPSKAKQLLAEAGYPEGFKTNCVVKSNVDVELTQIVKAYFSDIGVDMEIRTMDMASFLSYTGALKHDGLAQFENFGDHSPYVNLVTFYKNTGSSGRNLSNNNDPVFNEIVDNLRAVATVDEAKRLSIEGDRRYLEQLFQINTFPISTYTIWQPYLKGYSGERFSLFQSYIYWSKLWIDKDLKKSMSR